LKKATDEGMLIKDGRSLELLNQVDTIVFDKTGTLTEEQPHIGQVHPFAHYTEDEILYFAAIAEYKQKHPLARAILAEAAQRQIPSPSPEHSEYRLGYGIKVIFEGQTIIVGSAHFMESEGVAMPEHCTTLQATIKAAGNGFILVAVDQTLIGNIELLPTIRPEAKRAIRQLKQLKRIKKTYIISGDAEAPTARLAKELGIDHYFAHTLPQEKAVLIEKLQKENHFVCYIGDGINDAIAMKQAQVSISLNGASQLATDTAQIILLDQGISHLPRLFELAHGFKRHMNIQLSIIMVPSAVGLSTIFLTGMGMSGMMVLNMFSLSSSIGYSLFDRPQQQKSPTQAMTDQSVVQKTAMRTETGTDTEDEMLLVNEDNNAACYRCLPN
jgi:Cu2+-exporting ATPase